MPEYSVISKNILASLVVVLDGSNVAVGLHIKLLLHESLVKDPPCSINSCFKTPAVITPNNIVGMGLEYGNNQINKNLLVVVSLHDI